MGSQDHSINKEGKVYYFGDEYPVGLCNSICKLVNDAVLSEEGRSKSYPTFLAAETRLLEDILEDCDTDDLTMLLDSLPEDERLGCCNSVSNVAQVLKTGAMSVVDPKIKSLMNWLNSRPKGTVYNFGSEKVREANKAQIPALNELQLKYFPHHHFAKCICFSGTMHNIRKILLEHGEQAAVVMWKKTSQKQKNSQQTIYH